MIRLIIDGRPVAVEPGTTVLGAAEWLGIRIPTMCHVKGIKPASSCFVCAVQIEGRRTLSPACGMPAAEGMVVHTQTEDVRKARKMALELLLSDHAGECDAPCSARCPAGLDIPGFMFGIASGDTGSAMEVISHRLALAGSLGRVCPRLCEKDCRRCELDQGLTIGALHRYVADMDQALPLAEKLRENAPASERGQAKAGPPADFFSPSDAHASHQSRDCEGAVTRTPFLPRRESPSGKSVAIIGAGPAGISAAYYLQQKGHACTLFDAHEQAGGMLRYGIPEYRLPKQALDAEIAAVRQLGAEFRMGMRWGADFTLAQLRESHQAVFVAIGAQGAQGLRCPGEDLALPGIGFLEQVADGSTPLLGNDVIVVGGGNTAMDCARTAIRLGALVRVLYRRTRQEMPCLMEEVEGAEAEGVHIEYLVAPVSLERTPAGLSVTCRRIVLGEPDASGRRSPVPVEGSDFILPCSAVIAAIGQSVERSLAEREGLSVTRWGLAADPHTMATNLSGVFAGGDAVLGADLAVRAVAAGRMAAAGIHQYLSGEPVTGEPTHAAVVMRPVDDSERAAIFRTIEKAPRVPLPELPMARRLTSFDEVEGRLSTEDAIRESRRCMTCGCRKSARCTIRTLATEYGADLDRFAGERRRFSEDNSHPEVIYEPGKCISCDACVRIAAAEGEEFGMAMIGRGFDVRVSPPFERPLSEALTRTARQCAEACPTGALSMRTERACQFK